MSCVIAMAGKGGTGKTTIASLIIRILKENKLGSIIAIDADPSSNLAEALGTESKESIGEILDEVACNPGIIPVNMGKDAYIEFRVQTAITEGDGFDLLTMGRPEGPGCYCYVNNVLRNCIAKIINNYNFVIIDNEAGLEHLSRRTTQEADSLLIISDPSTAGLKAAERISRLKDELGIKIRNEFLIINRFNGSIDKKKIGRLKAIYLGSLGLDKEIEEASAKNGCLADLNTNNISINTLRKLGEKIWHYS